MPILTGSHPMALGGGYNTKNDCFGCDDIHSKHVPHPDAGNKKVHGKHLSEDERAAPPPARHTRGEHPSQLNPDHGPHYHRKG